MTTFDDMAWHQILTRPVPSGKLANHYGLAHSGRPASFTELEQVLRAGADFTSAWCNFLDEFYLYRRPEFFEAEPSLSFDAKTRAWFAGVVEYLCGRFGLPVPQWTGKPDYFLHEYWRKSHDDVCNPAFARRNIGYNPRHLIRL
jgi:hypothetical protein